MVDYEWQQSNVSKYYGNNQDVYVTMMDDSGNISPTRKVEITKIDRNKPSVNVALNQENLSEGKVTFTVYASDLDSKVSMYSFDKGKT